MSRRRKYELDLFGFYWFNRNYRNNRIEKKVTDDGSSFGYILLAGGFIISLYLLRLSLEEIPLSVAYAVWTGIGTAGAMVVGILFFKESRNHLCLLCIVGIICTIIVLRLLG